MNPAAQQLDTQNLLCPISGDFLVDPIATPCGHVVSRSELVLWVAREPTCPLCRADISAFDAQNAGRVGVLADLADQARAQGLGAPIAAGNGAIAPKLQATLTRLTNRNVAHRTGAIGRLEIKNTNQAFQRRTLLVPVVDHSGSMHSSPIEQAQASLYTMIDHTYTNSKSLSTTIVGYSSTADLHVVDTQLPAQISKQWVRDLSDTDKMQGTSFRAAFDAILKVCARHKDDAQIGALEVVFLTDGEDSAVGKPARGVLVDDFHQKLRAIWTKPFTVHTVGFGASHDADFLHALRKVGSTGEGAYRYAEPNENFDTLSGKINSIVDVVVASSAAPPMEMVPVTAEKLAAVNLPDGRQLRTAPKIAGEKGVYWVDLGALPIQEDDVTTVVFSVQMDNSAAGNAIFQVETTIQELDDDSKLWEEWWSLQLDRLAGGLQSINAAAAAAGANAQLSLDQKIRLQLFQDNLRKIASRLPDGHRERERISQLNALVTATQKGERVDARKLDDLSFEGRYATKTRDGAPNAHSTSAHKSLDAIVPPRSQFRNTQRQAWTVLQERTYSSALTTAGAAEPFDIVGLVTGRAYKMFAIHTETESEYHLADIETGSQGRTVRHGESANLDLPVLSHINVGNESVHISLYVPRGGMWRVVAEDPTADPKQRVGAESRKVSEPTKEVHVFGVLEHRPYSAAVAWFQRSANLWQTVRDIDGSNLLQIASSIKRSRVAEWIINECLAGRAPRELLHAANKQGYNAADLAALGGEWATYDRLVAAGVCVSIDGHMLLRTLLSLAQEHTERMQSKFPGLVKSANEQGLIHKYYAMAGRMIRDNVVTEIPASLIDAVPWNNPEAAKWLSARSQAGISMEKAVQMGMLDIVQQLIGQPAPPQSYPIQSFFGIFANPTAAHVQIIDLLATRGLVDVDATVPIKVNVVVDNHMVPDVFEDDISWPLFAAAERGRLAMVKVLLKHTKGATATERKSTINRTNGKHVTALWMAACNNHIDVELALLEAGADPNIANENGNSALIPCCKKGQTAAAQLLLDFGLDMNVYNPERDHPLLQSVRDSQEEMLKLLCEHVNTKYASTSPVAAVRPSDYANEEDAAAAAHAAAMSEFSLEEPVIAPTTAASSCVGNRSSSSTSQLLELMRKSNPIDGYEPLMACAETGHVGCLRICAKYGADVEARTSDDNKIIAGATALHIACFNGRVEAVRVLVQELGADATAKTGVLGHNVVHIAVIKRNIELLFALHSLLPPAVFAKLNATPDTDQRLPIYYAHSRGNEALLEEFYTDRLAVLLEQAMVFGAKDADMARKCARALLEEGRSAVSFDFDDLTSRVVGTKQTPLLTKAILSGNKLLVEAFRKMGADWNCGDASGLTPLFWAKCLDYPNAYLASVTGTDNTATTKAQTMLDRVKEACEFSSQSRMLLSLTRGPPSGPVAVTEEAQDNTSDLSRMIDGFATAIDSRTPIEVRRQAAATDLSLLGWLEKLKRGNIVESFEQLLWDAKVHVIGLLATHEKQKSQIDNAAGPAVEGIVSSTHSTQVHGWEPLHYLAVYLYTANASVFRQVNQCLGQWSSNSPDSVLWQPFVTGLYQAVSMLPAYEGECYRGIDAPFDADTYAIGKELAWDGFAMSSLHWNACTDLINDKKRGMIFIIKSNKCRVIAPYSACPVDGQVVSLPGARFTITNWFVADQFALSQTNIREHSYKMHAQPLVKVLAGKASILIELTQIA